MDRREDRDRSRVISIDEGQIKSHLGEIVRDTVVRKIFDTTDNPH